MSTDDRRAELERRAERVLANAFRGIHHVDGWHARRFEGDDLLRVTVYGELATYDFDSLTRLVVCAHDECVRLTIRQAGPRYWSLWFTPRVRDGGISERHPTMEQAIATVRGTQAHAEISLILLAAAGILARSFLWVCPECSHGVIERSDVRAFPDLLRCVACMARSSFSTKDIRVLFIEGDGKPVEAAPIPMLLFCPRCHMQHVDKAEPELGWDNPPHRSHTCKTHEGGCGTIWRPADVATTGVAMLATVGKADTWSLRDLTKATKPAENLTSTSEIEGMGALLAATRHPSELAVLRRVAWGLVHNAHRFNVRGGPLWAIVGDLTGQGSTAATALCRAFGVDPDREVPRLQLAEGDDA